MVPYFDLVTLTLKFDILLKNFNLGHNFPTKRERAFIFHMCVKCYLLNKNLNLGCYLMMVAARRVSSSDNCYWWYSVVNHYPATIRQSIWLWRRNEKCNVGLLAKGKLLSNFMCIVHVYDWFWVKRSRPTSIPGNETLVGVRYRLQFLPITCEIFWVWYREHFPTITFKLYTNLAKREVEPYWFHIIRVSGQSQLGPNCKAGADPGIFVRGGSNFLKILTSKKKVGGGVS